MSAAMMPNRKQPEVDESDLAREHAPLLDHDERRDESHAADESERDG
jgi:hypothetical protein